MKYFVVTVQEVTLDSSGLIESVVSKKYTKPIQADDWKLALFKAVKASDKIIKVPTAHRPKHEIDPLL
jgi:hypothetical protein